VTEFNDFTLPLDNASQEEMARSPNCSLKRSLAGPSTGRAKRYRTITEFISPASDDRTDGDLAPGQFCIAHWRKWGWYAVIILPRDGSFKELGLKGSVVEVFNSVPADGEIPVMAFEDEQSTDGLKDKIPPELLAWRPPKNMLPLAPTGPDGKAVNGYDVTVEWQEKLKSKRKVHYSVP